MTHKVVHALFGWTLLLAGAAFLAAAILLALLIWGVGILDWLVKTLLGG